MNKNFNHGFRHTNNVLNYFQRHGKKYLFGTLGAFAIVKMALLFVGFFSTLDLGKSFAQTPVVLTSGNIVSEYGCDTTATQCDFKGITSIESDAFVNHTQLQDLFLAGNQLTSIDGVVFPNSLQTLFLDNNQLTSIDGVVFPNSLQTLLLYNNQLTSIDGVVFPENLQNLNLDYNQLTSIDGVVFPNSLQTLNLYNNQLTSIDGVVFPNSLQTLNLDYNQLTSIDGVVFPENLQNLFLAGNQLTSIDGVVFPNSLQTLFLDNNQLTSIDGVVFPENLQNLFLAGNQLTSIDGVVFPENLQTLNLYYNQLTSIDGVVFPENLQNLFLAGNQLTSIDGVVFPNSLQTLNLYNNQLTSIDGVVFPENLQNLNLDYNQLTSIDGVVFPENLQNLFLAGNQLTSIDGVVFPNSLQTLNLYNNQLTSIDGVVFPENLQNLNLYNNQLTSIDGVVFPENLQNLNLDYNQLTSIDGVVFPNSLQTLFLYNNQLTSLPETIKQLVNLIGNKGLQIYYNRIDYHQLSDELLSFVDQKTDGDWRATQQIEVLGCTDPRANNYNPNATKNDGSCDYSVDQQGDFSIDGSFLLKEMLAEAKVYSGGLLPFSIEAAYSGQRSSATIYVGVPFDFNFDYTLPFKSSFSGDSKIVYGGPGDGCYADFIKGTGKYVDHIDNLIETLLASLLNCDGYPEKDCQINIPDLYPEPILLKHSAEILASSGMKAWAWAIVDALNLLGTVKQKEDFITVSKIVKEYLSNGIPASSIMSQVCVFFGEYSLESCPIFEALGVALGLDKIENCGAKVYSYDQELYYGTREATFFGRHPYVAGGFDINLFISSDETIDMDISNNTKTIHIDMTEGEGMSCTNSSETINILDGNIGEAYVNPSDYGFGVKDEKKKIEDPNMKEEEEQARELRGLAKAKISDCEPVFLWCLDGDSYLIADGLFPVGTGEVYHNDSCKHPIRPIASNLNIFGEVTVGSKLLGTYDFTYNNGIWNNLFEIQKGEIRHLVISPNGTPIIAYQDWSFKQGFVAEHTNGTWNQLGNGIQDGEIRHLVISPNGTPIIAYNYWDGYSNQLVVAEYTNGTWNQLGDEINGNIGQLVLSPNGTPIIAYQDWSSKQGFVAEYTNGTWNQLGDEINGSIGQLVLSPNGTPIIAYQDGSSKQGFVAEYSNGTWNNLFEIQKGEIRHLVISPNGTPMIAYNYWDGYSTQLVVAEYSNGTWNQLFEIQKDNIRHLVISPNGTPIIAYNYWDGYSNQLVVAEYTNGTWNQLGDEINGSIGQLVLSPNGTPIIAYQDWSFKQGFVAEHTNGTWNQLGDEINGSIGQLVLSPNGTPIIAYHNGSLGQSFVAEYSSLGEGTSTYQRYRDGKPIVGATDIEYAITSSDLGHTLFFEVEPESEDRVLGLKVMSEGLYIPKPQTSNKGDLGGGGGAGGYLIKDNCCLNGGLLGGNELCKDYSDSYYDGTCKGGFHESADICGINKSNYSDELKLTYLYSYNYGITTICPIRDAKLDGYLYRNHFAKMISEYAINVMGKKPDVGKKGCDQFQDIEKESDELKYFMKTACELNLMGLHPDGKTPKDNFDPNDIVTRAEFGTVFSRLLFGDKYNIKDDNLLNKNEGYWYKDHLAGLKTNGIMTKIDNPKSKELRGWTMLMLMRAGKILKNK